MNSFSIAIVLTAALSVFAIPGTLLGQCKLIDNRRDGVFITFEKIAKVRVEDADGPQDGVLLRINNNSSCAIIITAFDGKKFLKPLPAKPTVQQILKRGIEYDLPNGELVPDLVYNYYIDYKLSRYAFGDVRFGFRVLGGRSILFGVPLSHLMEAGLELPFQYAWEAENRAKDNYSSVETYVRFSGGDLPDAVIAKLASSRPLPRNWFEPINDPNKPDWEILPQEAKAGEVILSKRNELGILSNFAATLFELDEKEYASVEGFWQMMLYPEGPGDERAKDKRVTWKFTREQVAQMTGFEAKSAGTLAEENMKTLGIDWVTYNGKRFPYRSATPGEHYKLILAAMRAKLNQNPEVKRILLATGDLILKPDHVQEPHAPPEWKYNEIWMQLRAELQKPARQ